MTVFGTSAKYIDALAKLGLEADATRIGSTSVKTMASTGSPLVAGELRLRLQQHQAGPAACRRSPAAPTSSPASCSAARCCRCIAARSSAAGSGMKVEVYDDEGKPVRGEKGELVCTAPFPSMPIGFWNDPDGQQVPRRLLRALSRRLVPRRLHGADRARRRDHLRPLRRGAQSRRRAHRHRRDLPPGRAAERSGGEPGHRPGLGQRRARRAVRAPARRAARSTRRSTKKIKAQIRSNTTPRHVPAKIMQVADIPRTKSGKIVELAVRNVVARPAGQEQRGAGESRGAGAVPESRGLERSGFLQDTITALVSPGAPLHPIAVSVLPAHRSL